MTATQETNKAYLKVIFDTNKINRIVQRIENVVPDLYENKKAIVIVGSLKMNDKGYKRYPNKGNYAHVNSETFAPYRQIEILNFYCGENIFVRPTIQQKEKSLLSTKDRRAWPAPESVYTTEDGVVVVLLKKYKLGEHVTWTK